MAVVAVVSAAAKQVSSLLADEAKFLWGVEEQVKKLEKELQWMQNFLQEADARQVEDKRVRQWVLEIRDIAYDVEAVIETFVLKIASKRKGGCSNCMKRCSCILKEAWGLHKVRSEMEEITAKINELTRRLQTYGIKQLAEGESSSSWHARQRERRRSYAHIVEDNLVAIDVKINEMVSLMIGEETDRSRFVCIHGMGGVGKTTLAKKIFYDDRVRGHFVRFAWAYVSPQFEKEDVWEEILSCFGVQIDHTIRTQTADIIFKRRNTQQLAQQLHNSLKADKCLVILDDVWNIGDWDALKPAFPMEGTQSKILITSRNQLDIALHADRKGHLHQLQSLNDEESWYLLQKIVFHGRDHMRDRVGMEMEELGKKIARRCQGLPLAIRAIGGILSTKDCTYNEWKVVYENVKSYLRKDKDYSVQDALVLSYDDLPPYLKPCFLYLAHFPEGYDIPAEKLIHMWVAEGFIPSEEEEATELETMEDIAERYLVELLERCMIQVGERHSNLRIKTCRMHDFMRELCLSKVREQNFLCITDHFSKDRERGIAPSVAAMINKVHRLAIHETVTIERIKNPSLRTMLFFNDIIPQYAEEYPKGSLAEKAGDYIKSGKSKFLKYIFALTIVLPMVLQSRNHILSNFKKLRVLDFERVTFLSYNLPKKIDNLVHLRYLCLAKVPLMNKLPSSLGKLRCLQTLDLRVGTSPCALRIPDVIWKMEQLRHLYLPEVCRYTTRLRLSTLKDLQTLVNLPVNNSNIVEIGNLTKLRELSMRGRLDYYYQLQRNCPTCCCCCEFSDYMKSGEYLGLEEDPMAILGGLPNLKILAIEAGAFIGHKMVLSRASFPKLESLTLDSLTNLNILRVDEGALPNLLYLKIKNCQKLKRLPEGFRSVTTLQKVDIEEMPGDFRNWLKDDETPAAVSNTGT